MALLEWDPQITPRLKLGFHGAQIVLSFVLWCLEIAVFRNAKVVGTNGWTFGVCFLSIPAWIYLLMTPRFGRTRRLANPYVMFAVDVVFVIIWLSAFATQASFNNSNLCGSVCGISKAIVGLGVIITLLWVGSTLVSAYTMQYYNFHGSLPGYDTRKLGGENIDPDKAAFSMAPHDEEAYERVNMDDHDGPGSSYDDPAGPSGRYGDGNPYSADDYDDPSRYGTAASRRNNNNNNALFDSETEYTGAGSALGLGGGGHKSPSPSPYGAGAGASSRPEPYDDGPVQFPSGNYDRIE